VSAIEPLPAKYRALVLIVAIICAVILTLYLIQMGYDTNLYMAVLAFIAIVIGYAFGVGKKGALSTALWASRVMWLARMIEDLDPNARGHVIKYFRRLKDVWPEAYEVLEQALKMVAGVEVRAR